MKEKTTITFLAAECGEFHGMGECIEYVPPCIWYPLNRTASG